MRAADLWSRSASVSDKLLSLVTEARAAQPGLERVVTIDLPSYLTDGGFTVPFGSYNLPKLLALRSPGLLVDRFRLRPERPGQIWGARIAPLSARAVHALVLDRTRLVLRYDSGPGVLHRLDPAGHVPATALTRDRTPELAWREGAWPWLLVTSEDALDVPMAIPAGGWLALRFLSGPSTSLLLSVDDSPPRGVGPDHTRPPCWTTLTKAAPEPHAAASLDLHSVRLESKDPLAIAGIWSFRPQSRYSPESSPYLGWLGDGPDRFFEVAGELDLPLVLPGGGTARRTEVLVRVLLSAENVGELRLDDQTFALGGPENGPPRWTTIRLNPRAGSTGLLTIRRTGQATVRVGVVEVQ